MYWPRTKSGPLSTNILGGIEYAAGVTAADCGATLDANFARGVLDDEAENPIDLAVAPDGRVFFIIERKGELKVYRPGRRAGFWCSGWCCCANAQIGRGEAV